MRLLLALLLPAVLATAQDLLVIAPKPFRSALAEWRTHREAQGHEIAVREPAEDLRGLVREVHAASGGKLRFVLLLGDVKRIPCEYVDGEVIVPYERDPRIANDHYLSDLDGDDLPDLAVGRVPADSAKEADLMLGKVVAYERNADYTPWRRRINVVAAVAGFGKLQDWALEQVATRFLTQNVPAAYDLHVTYVQPDSPFCPPPETIRETALERFNEGALILAYMGHGSRLRLDRVRFGKGRHVIFDEESAYEWEVRHGSPIAVFVACSTGHFDGAPDCLAEVALKQPRGPVAVIASTRVSMPYANGVLAKEVLDALFLQKASTVGEMLKLAKRRLVKAKPGDKGRQFIETLAIGYQWDAKKREAERAEHLWLYNLFGDPATRIPLPAEVAVVCAQEARPGGRLKVVGRSPYPGEATVELVEAPHPDVEKREGVRPEDYRRAYERSNDWVRVRTTVPVADAAFEVELELPETLAKRDHFVRVFVRGHDGAAVGSAPVRILEKAQ